MVSKESREDLRSFDNTHLEKLRIMFYDRWTFETGAKADKDFHDAVEAELESRKPKPVNPGSISFTTGIDGAITMDVVLQAEALKFNDEHLFIKSKYGLRFGHEFERELKRVVREELSKLLLKN